MAAPVMTQRLPLSALGIPEQQEPEPMTTRAGPPVNILVVDDNPDKLLAMRTVLEELNENVVTAQSGEEALRFLLKEEVAVILLDVKMPIMDGFETAELIRRRKRFAHTPIIFVTAYEDEMRTAKAYELGAVDYILAPIIPRVLCSKVKVFVQLFRMREEIRQHSEQRIALAREQAARAAAEESIRRSNFLVSASRVLSASLDVDAVLRGITNFVVPFLSETCALGLTGEAGEPTHLAGAASVPGGRRVAISDASLQALFQRLDDHRERALEDGELVTAELHDGFELSLSAKDGEVAEVQIAQAVLLPLLARGRKLGVLVLGFEQGQGLTAGQQSIALELSGRTAIALDNAMLYSRVQEADRRKDEFLAMLAHELRAPLAPIRNAAAVLQRSQIDDQGVHRSRDIIERQIAHLGRLVDDLLDVARLSKGKIRLDHTTVSLHAVMDRAIETNASGIEQRGHTLNVRLPSRPVHVPGDPVRLAQIFGNLLNNAIKYTPPGGTIDLVGELADGGLVVRVRDNGSGIPIEMLPQVFDLFVQANASLARAEGGLGVGLTLVRKLVELHGGRVEVQSGGPGAGSEFIVRLPVEDDGPQVESEEPESLPSQGGGSLRVLVIDDNIDAVETTAMLLELYGHELRKAADGPTALALADEFKPQLVLCDLGLPGMDGYEVARRLRESDLGERMRLVAITGYAQEEDRRRAREAGFDDHLVKPVDPMLLLEMLQGLASAGTPAREAQ
jgi:signal transduction histidine kinase/DNA-binding response OmpR family regulator